MSNTNYRGAAHRDIAAAEAEIAELERERSAPPTPDGETPPQESVSVNPKDAQEATWEQRYANLRRREQELIREHQAQIDDLQGQITALASQSLNVPTNEAEIAAWMEEFPQVAAIVEAIAARQAKDHSDVLDQRLRQIEQREKVTDYERAILTITKAHPDFHELSQDTKFHEWLQGKSKRLQDTIYKSLDVEGAIDVLTLYKLETGKAKKKETVSPASAAAAVRPGGNATADPGASAGRKWKESEIAAMSGIEFERYMADIEAAQREGRIIRDMSAGAR